MDAGLKRELEAKVYAGERLTHADGVALYASDDLAWLGRLAHHRRTAATGDRVTFGAREAAAEGAGGPAAESAREAAAESAAGGGADGAVGGSAGGTVGEVAGRARLSYEPGDDPQQRVDHILSLRARQDETGEFTVFAPMTPGAPAETLKTFAVSRLLFDNVPHVSCSWPVHGLPVAQLALNFGADDLDGPLTGDGDELLHLIWDAGFQPVERDARHQVIREHEKAPSLAERRSEPQKIWA